MDSPSKRLPREISDRSSLIIVSTLGLWLKLESRITRCTDIEPNRSMAINLLDPGQGLAEEARYPDGSRFRRRDNRRVWQS